MEIDYKNIKTDKGKLYACYSLAEQMRLQHNKIVVVAQGDINRYVKSGKFKAYAQESKRRLKELLAEQGRLKEEILRDNYTPEQWKEISQLSFEEKFAITQSLFGDRQQEKVKLTKATSLLLDELRAVNLDDMPATSSSDPTEDFSTYTEVDEGGDITKTSDRITFTLSETREDTFHVHYDKGAGHFDGNFEHLGRIELTVFNDFACITTWALSNAVGDLKDLRDATEDYLCFFVYRDGASYRLYLEESDGGAEYSDLYANFPLSTVYYLELERDESIGTFGTTYAYICTGDYWDDGGTQVDTLSVALHTSKKDFRYIYGLTGYDDGVGAGKTATGYIEFLDLQEIFTPWAIIM